MTLVLSAVAAMLSKDMAFVLQMQQRPVVMVATQDDATALAAIAAVRSPVRVVLHVTQVHGATTALTRTTVNLYVVNEITLHIVVVTIVAIASIGTIDCLLPPEYP